MSRRRLLSLPLLLFGMILLTVLIRAEIIIDLDEESSPRNLIIVRVGGDHECVSVSEVFPAAPILVGSRHHDAGYTTRRNYSKSLATFAVVVFNVQSNYVCSQGKRKLLLTSNEDKPPQPREGKTTISLFHVFVP